MGDFEVGYGEQGKLGNNVWYVLVFQGGYDVLGCILLDFVKKVVYIQKRYLRLDKKRFVQKLYLQKAATQRLRYDHLPLIETCWNVLEDYKHYIKQ